MAYDKSNDKELFSKSATVGEDTLVVAIYQYGEGAKKLQISRTKADDKFAKLGRMTKDEISAVLPLIQEAVKEM